MKITIQIEAPTWLRTLSKVALPALAILAAGVVLAVPPGMPASWAPNSQLTSTALNKAFADINTYEGTLDARMTVLEAPTYCGKTVPYDGALTGSPVGNGYRGAQKLCAQQCGSPTAHMCTSDEMQRIARGGYTSPTALGGWIAGGGYNYYTYAGNNLTDNDCEGYTNAVTVEAGSEWNWTASAPGGVPSLQACGSASPLPILCCN